MTIFATPDTERLLAELDARTRVAWTEYSDALRDLDGRAYEDTEAAAWEELEAQLRDIEHARAELERS